MTRLPRSREALERALRVIPLGAQTLSKTSTQFVGNVVPLFADRATGAHIWDVDGNRWLDYPMALGPVLLGYCDPTVDDAIRTQLARGITYTLSHPLEAEVAERVVALCPGVEAVRFAKSGSDAMSAAVRAARFQTGRELVAVMGYHGWHDWYIGTTTRAGGIPGAVKKLSTAVRFNDFDSLGDLFDRHGNNLAAVVLEPSGVEVPEPGFLEAVVDGARAVGARSIFDEIITGFRLAPGGARERYGVQPDYSCYGKALGNGMPISAVAGSWDEMVAFEEVFFSGTHGGETLSLAAARAVLDVIADGTVLAAIESRGRRLMDGLEAAVIGHAVADRVRVSGEPQRAVVSFTGSDSLLDKSFAQQRFAEAGILFNGSMFISAAHTDVDVDSTVSVFEKLCSELAASVDIAAELGGSPVEAVFRNP